MNSSTENLPAPAGKSDPPLRLLVSGGQGLLAHALGRLSPPGIQLTHLGHQEFDLTRPESMRRRLDDIRPDVVINTASYNLVDRCEIERDLSWQVNATGPRLLAGLCAERGIRMVHYGTDYVFDGAKRAPYLETDQPRPLNHYAEGKLVGEQATLAASPVNLVLRTSWVFDWHPTQAKSYVHTILRAAQAGKALKATTDQVSIPTLASDLARWTLELLQRGAAGLFHSVSEGGISRYDWTREIVTAAFAAGLLPAVPPVEPVLCSYFSTAIQRPDYTVLSNAKLAAALGHPMDSWRPALRKVLAQLKTSSLA